MSKQLLKIAVLFILSFFVTAIFSVSLKVFFAGESWTLNLSKGLLIPCFTWTVQLILSAIFLDRKESLIYWEQLGVICLVGSVVLLPAAIYNFASASPLPLVSVCNVLASVAVMSLMLFFRLKPRGFKARWAIGWTATIIVNMSLYLYSIS
jgi:hypothetical protein